MPDADGDNTTTIARCWYNTSTRPIVYLHVYHSDQFQSSNIGNTSIYSPTKHASSAKQLTVLY